jgi:hypothetical protein
MAATITAAGTLDLIDGAERWSLAGGRAFTTVQLAESAVLATTQDALLVWRIDLPATPAAAAVWLDSLTNARVDGGPTAPLAWR